MSRLFAYIGRFAAIIAGYGFAALVASTFLHLLLLGGLDWRPAGPGVGSIGQSALLFSVPFVALVAGYLAFLPALPVIVVSESYGWRDWLFFALGGGAVAIVVIVMIFGLRGAVDTPLLLAMIAAGMVAGIAYWLAAGRNAGRVLDRVVSGREP